MNARILIAAAVSVVGLSAGTAHAQGSPWTSDKKVGEGAGIRAGNLELHPGLAGEVGYDTNYFQRSDDEGEIAIYRFRVTPSLTLSTLGPQRTQGGPGAKPPAIEFDMGVAANYSRLLAADSDFSDQVSDQAPLDVQASANLKILPRRPWGGDLFAGLVRTAQPSNDPGIRLAFTRDTVKAGGGLVWQPGGGLFDWRLGYKFQGVFFENSDFRDFDNATHEVNTRGRWRFLPRTALLYDASLGFQGYSRSSTGQADSTPVRARVGLNGLVTNRLALLAMAGWGASFYESRNGEPVSDFDSFIGEAALTWYLIANPTIEPGEASVGLSSVSLGYRRDFFNSYLSNFYQMDRGYLKFSSFLGGDVVLTVEGGLSRIDHPPSFFAGTTAVQSAGVTEMRADAQVFGEYRFSDSFGVNTTLRYDASLGENQIQVSATDPTLQDNLQYQRFQAFLGARWFM